MFKVYIYIYIIFRLLLYCPGSNPGGDEIFRPSRPAPGAIQPPVKWVPGLSRGYSVAGACSPPSSAAVIGRVELYLYPPSGPHRACKGITLPFTVIFSVVTVSCKGHELTNIQNFNSLFLKNPARSRIFIATLGINGSYV